MYVDSHVPVKFGIINKWKVNKTMRYMRNENVGFFYYYCYYYYYYYFRARQHKACIQKILKKIDMTTVTFTPCCGRRTHRT